MSIKERVTQELSTLLYNIKNGDDEIYSHALLDCEDNILKVIKEELTVISDEDIYNLNKADTEQRRRLFWESGVLDTCKSAVKFQLAHNLKQLEGE